MSGSGSNQVLNVTYSDNSGTSIRAASIAVNDAAYYLRQQAPPQISPTSKNFTKDSISFSIVVTADVGQAWSAQAPATYVVGSYSFPGFVQLKVGTAVAAYAVNGTGSDTVTVYVAGNTLTAERKETLTIAGNSFSVTQPRA
jgi:hypothetical protein